MSGRWGGRPDPHTPKPVVVAADASASVGWDIRCDVTDTEKPWCVVEWPGGKESRFETKQEAYDHIMSSDEKEFWDEGKGAKRDRDRVR